MAGNQQFLQSDHSEPHRERTRAILKEHPEIRELIGRNPSSFLFIAAIVTLQLTLAALLQGQSWWLIILTAYMVGAFANHSLYVLTHECTHNLIFKQRVWNCLAGILTDLPNVIPTSVSFRRYHLKHHSFQGVYDLDADMPSSWEAKLIRNAPFGKMLWLMFFPVFQLLRPPRLREIKFMDSWTLLNMLVVLVTDILILYFLGGKAFLYLFCSLFFSVGLHPLGARWIQEHYLVSPPQETYSYYGPLNLLAFNVGYHNEHHDFPSIPWSRLPEVRRTASAYYDTLTYHRSWVKLLLKFLFDPELSLYSRMERHERGGVTLNGKINPVDVLHGA